MKKKIQKYLAGEREGFSLVELIIVIAIMAILIGVVTLAVLPNIAKSKESKDMTALDSILSALNNAVASQQLTTGSTFEMTEVDAPSGGGKVAGEFKFPSDSVAQEVKKLMGKDSIKLSSSKAAASGNKIVCSWTLTGGTIGITVEVQDSSNATVKSEYLGDFKVSN